MYNAGNGQRYSLNYVWQPAPDHRGRHVAGKLRPPARRRCARLSGRHHCRAPRPGSRSAIYARAGVAADAGLVPRSINSKSAGYHPRDSPPDSKRQSCYLRRRSPSGGISGTGAASSLGATLVVARFALASGCRNGRQNSIAGREWTGTAPQAGGRGCGVSWKSRLDGKASAPICDSAPAPLSEYGAITGGLVLGSSSQTLRSRK